jgi:hypothetical protein
VTPSKRNAETARSLRAVVPRVDADDRFIAVLADLAASSTPAADHSRVGKTGLRVKIAAVTASVALVSVGAAYGDQFGSVERAPVGPTDTFDPASPSGPASPSEPDEGFEENDEDFAPHDLDEGPEHHPNGRAGNGVHVDPGVQDSGVEGSPPLAPAPPGQAGQDEPAQEESHPRSTEPEGSTAPDDDPAANPDQTDGPDADPDADPEADPDPADTDADPSDEADSGGPSEANLDSAAQVDDR